MRYILFILFVGTMFACVPDPVYDCTTADTARMDKYMDTCSKKGTHSWQCVLNAEKLFCKPVCVK